MMLDGRGILLNDLTLNGPMRGSIECYYSWDCFKSLSARDLVISRDLL